MNNFDPEKSGNFAVAHSPDISEQFQSSDSPYFDDPDFILYVINLLIPISLLFISSCNSFDFQLGFDFHLNVWLNLHITIQD